MSGLGTSVGWWEKYVVGQDVILDSFDYSACGCYFVCLVQNSEEDYERWRRESRGNGGVYLESICTWNFNEKIDQINSRVIIGKRQPSEERGSFDVNARKYSGKCFCTYWSSGRSRTNLAFVVVQRGTLGGIRLWTSRVKIEAKKKEEVQEIKGAELRLAANLNDYRLEHRKNVIFIDILTQIMTPRQDWPQSPTSKDKSQFFTSPPASLSAARVQESREVQSEDVPQG